MATDLPSSAWTAAEVAPPPVSGSSGARVTQWSPMRADADPTFVAGCVAAPIPGWVEDMRPAVEARSVGLVASTAQRLARTPVDARGEGGVFVLRAAGTSGAGALGTARTFLGFDEDHVFTCFAACVATAPSSAPQACDAAVARARLERSAPPPHPSMALAAVTWGVHHPRETAGAAAFVTVALGALAIVTRRRPRVVGRSASK